MAWGYRKSIRMPLGFRVNLSKSGIGYSWGVRGFRTGMSAKKQRYEVLSIPGTGLYDRHFLRPHQHVTRIGMGILMVSVLYTVIRFFVS